MLIGREAECRRIDGLMAEARSGASSSLLIQGEPGIGKSALLRYAIDQAAGMRVLTARGVESESEIAFSGLADLLRPLVDRLNRLPQPQAAALAGALAIGPAASADRYAIFAATLNLFALASEDSPMLVAVDDAHWIDAASAEGLLFVARRLKAEGIVFLAIARSGEPSCFVSAGLTELKLKGLDWEAAKTVLAAGGRPISASVARQLFSATLGNPLALREIPTLLSEAQLAGTTPLDDPLPAGASIERAFMRRLAALGPASRRVLLVAAASDSEDMELIVRASAHLRIDAATVGEAEAAGLINIRMGTVEWHHPLVRSAIYHSAAAPDRREAHRALAAALGELRFNDRRAWHLAAAAISPDAEIAGMLEEAARDARLRNAHAAAARTFERAARLTPEPPERVRRLYEAARDAQLAGSVDYAVSLSEEALASTRDPILRADIQMVRAQTEMWARNANTALRVFQQESAAIETIDRGRAARMLAEAAIGCSMHGDIPRVIELAARCRAIAGNDYPDVSAVAEATYCNALVLAGEGRIAAPVLAGFRREFEQAPLKLLTSPALVQAVVHSSLWIEEFDDVDRLLRGIIEAGRAANAMGLLPFPLGIQSELDFRTGRWGAATAEAAESMQLAIDTSQPNLLGFNLVCLAAVEAAQGRTDACQTHVAQAIELATRVGAESLLVYSHAALGLEALGGGRPEDAIIHLETVNTLAREDGLGEPGVVLWGGDWIEAYIRAGRMDEARAALEAFEAQAEHTQRNWALAVAARCHGMLANSDGSEAFFQRALDLHHRTPTPFELARTELCFAQQLRRKSGTDVAQKLLRSALSTFQSLCAEPWADAARRELRLCGVRISGGQTSAMSVLTPQELQVALMVARGASNKEAAAALFVSPKTIEFHLGNLYRKLGLQSRTALASLFARDVSIGELTPVRRGERVRATLSVDAVRN